MTNEHLARRILRYRWVIFWIIAVAYAFVYFHRLCPAVVALDIQGAFHASARIVGVFASAYFYPYAIMQFPAGLLSDYLGPRATATLFLVIAGTGSILFGLAPGMDTAVAARVLVGIGMSVVFLSAMKLFSQWFRIREFALVAAIFLTMGGVGALVAATPLALITEWIGWRASFELMGVGTFVIAILVWLLVRNRPQDMNLPSVAEMESAAAEVAGPVRQIPIWEAAHRVITEKYFWSLALYLFFACGIFFAFSGLWAGPYLMHVYGMSRAEAASVLNMTAVGMIVGSPSVTVLSDRVFHGRKTVVMLFTGVLVAELAVLNVFPNGLPQPILYLVFFLLSVCSAAVSMLAVVATKELFPIQIAGTCIGAVNLFNFLGGAVTQVLLGAVLDTYPRSGSGAYPMEAYSTMLFVLLVMAVGALACTFMMKETFPAGSLR